MAKHWGVMAVLLLGISCGGGGGGGEGGGASSEAGSSAASEGQKPQVTVALGDAPLEGLDHFTVVVTQCRLVRPDGPDVVLYNGSGVKLNLLAHNFINRLIASSEAPPGTYAGVRLRVEGAEASSSAAAQQVQIEGGATWPLWVLGYFPAPIALSWNGAANIVCDFDLRQSISDGGGNTVLFRPVLGARPQEEEIALDYFRARVTSVDAAQGTFTCQLSSGVQLQVRIASTSVLHGIGAWSLGWLALPHISVGDMLDLSGDLSAAALWLDCGEWEDEPDDPTYEFHGVATARGWGWVQARCLEDVPGLGATVGQTVTIQTSWATGIDAEGGWMDASAVPIGSEVEFECYVGTSIAALVHLEHTQLSGTVSWIFGSWVGLTNCTSAGIPLSGTLACRIPSGTEILLGETVPVSAASMTVGGRISILCGWDSWSSSFIADRVRVHGESVTLLLSSLTNVQRTSDGGCSFVSGGMLYVLSAAAEVVLSVADRYTCYTLTPDQLPEGLANQDSGEITVETDPASPPGQRSGGRAVVRGNNGVGNGLDPQPPGNPPPNDLEGTGPGNPGNQGGANP